MAGCDHIRLHDSIVFMKGKAVCTSFFFLMSLSYVGKEIRFLLLLGLGVRKKLCFDHKLNCQLVRPVLVSKFKIRARTELKALELRIMMIELNIAVFLLYHSACIILAFMSLIFVFDERLEYGRSICPWQLLPQGRQSIVGPLLPINPGGKTVKC